VRCSRCSCEGRAERDPGHTAPAVTPPRHNLSEEKGKEREKERRRQAE